MPRDNGWRRPALDSAELIGVMVPEFQEVHLPLSIFPVTHSPVTHPLAICLSTHHPSTHLLSFLHPSTHPPTFHLSISSPLYQLPTCLPLYHPSIHPPAHSPIHLFVCPSLHHLSIVLPTHLSTAHTSSIHYRC